MPKTTAENGAGVNLLAEGRYKVGGESVGPVAPAPVRQKRSTEVQNRMLDVAEYVFAKWGYAAVSIRDVTSLADMGVANVSYYFGSKQNLYFEVLRRRAQPLAQMRPERLQAARARRLGGSRKLRALVNAYADPPLELSSEGDAGWKNFFLLISQVTFNAFAPPPIAEFFSQPAREFMAGLRDPYPWVPEASIQAAAILMIGPCIAVISEPGRIETSSERAYSSGALDLLGPMMKGFIAGGIRGMLGEAKS